MCSSQCEILDTRYSMQSETEEIPKLAHCIHFSLTLKLLYSAYRMREHNLVIKKACGIKIWI